MRPKPGSSRGRSCRRWRQKSVYQSFPDRQGPFWRSSGGSVGDAGEKMRSGARIGDEPLPGPSDGDRVSMVLVRGLVVARPATCLCVTARRQVVHLLLDELGVRRGRFERCGAALVALALAPQPKMGEDAADHGRIFDETMIFIPDPPQHVIHLSPRFPPKVSPSRRKNT
jgi:hypothetical protein